MSTQLKQTNSLSETGKSLLTLFLLLHLFCVLLALASSVMASPLQMRILAVLRPYVRLLNFELPYSQYHLTHGTPLDVDHRIEVLPNQSNADEADSWLVLPDRGHRAGERYKRYQRLAKRIAVLEQLSEGGVQDMSSAVSEISASIGNHFFHAENIVPLQVRSRQHFLQGIEAVAGGTNEQRDPNSSEYFQVPYAANILVHDDGTVSVSKIEESREVARPAEEAN